MLCIKHALGRRLDVSPLVPHGLEGICNVAHGANVPIDEEAAPYKRSRASGDVSARLPL
jgi:hypothetical protein